MMQKTEAGFSAAPETVECEGAIFVSHRHKEK